MTKNLAAVSAADASYFDLLQGTVRSLRDQPQGRDIALYVFDLGLTEPQRRWLLVQGATLRHPPGLPGCDDLPIHLRAFLSRCRIPELFPGPEVYLWIDADAWVQRWDAVESYVTGARLAGFAITLEVDPAYDANTVLTAHRRPFAMFGEAALAGLQRSGPCNAGVFAGRANAPHWQEWRRLIETTVGSTRDLNLLFLLDQTALAITCTQSGLPAALLSATCNWVAHSALPAVSDDGAVLLRPLPPHEALGVVHQTWFTKRDFFALRRKSGGHLSRSVSYQAHSQLPRDDYVSPGLTVILPDRCFPEMGRMPRAGPGFFNRDEAHILYNLALGFCGKRALAIGSAIGWSACHLAMAGLELDLIEPLLANPSVTTAVQASLKAARVPRPVRLVPGASPDAVHRLAATRQGWSLVLIDGSRESEAPLADVQACERYAAVDCAMVLHGLVAPNVTEAALYLKARGWNVRVYYTAEIMAVTWRGKMEPVAHLPDPRDHRQIPDHVMPLLA